MAKIISSKKQKNKVILEVMCDYDEYLNLQGHLEDVYLFTEHTAIVKSNISQKGRNGATKYFLIPKQLRKGFKLNNETSCQKIELKNKIIFIYIVDKNKIIPSKHEIILEKLRK